MTPSLARRAARAAFPALLVALLVASPPGVPPAHAEPGAVVWTSPTRAQNARFTVKAGTTLTFMMAASAPNTGHVTIGPVGGLPPGATVSTYEAGGKARSVFRWRPVAVGEYTLSFVASVRGRAAGPSRTYVIRVHPNVIYPHSYVLTDDSLGHWAEVLRRTVVRSQPHPSAPRVTTLGLLTPDDTQNLVLVLGGVDLSPTKTWYRVRLAILPNNSTGWVPRDALGDLVEVDTHLYLDRARLTLTLVRGGKAIFETTVGVGRSFWPTPRGEFYVRNKLTHFDSPTYGPIAFGTSARATKLTDWPGGGVIGIHGTDKPDLLPGRVSHGCIRLRNVDILRLAQLLRLGTPVTIR